MSSTTTERLQEAIDAVLPEGDYVPAVVAAQVMQALMRDNPKLLKEWMYEHALIFLTQYIAKRSQDQRQAVRRAVERREVFGKAVEAAEAGDTEPLGMFGIRFVVDDKNTRRRLADMTGQDHQFVAARYTANAKQAMMQAAFHTALAKKVGDKRTEDVMDKEECQRLYESIVVAPKSKRVRAA